MSVAHVSRRVEIRGFSKGYPQHESTYIYKEFGDAARNVDLAILVFWGFVGRGGNNPPVWVSGNTVLLCLL